MITAVFKNGVQISTVGMLWQYGYGQKLRIEGLDLPSAVEIDFSLSAEGGDSVTRIGLTEDGVTDVAIPDAMLENGDTDTSYYLYAFIYLADEESGETRYTATLYVRARAKREASATSEESYAWSEVVNALNGYYEDATAAATLSESWAVGGTDTRDGEDTDNAKYYAQSAADSAATAGDAAEEIKEATKAAAEQQAMLEDATEKAGAQQSTLENATENAATQQSTLENATENAATQQSTLEGATSAAAAQEESLKSATSEANTANATLAETTETANAANSTLTETTSTANAANDTLAETTEKANTANSTLEETISDAGTANTALAGTIDSAGTANSTLAGTVRAAESTNATLNDSTSAASEMKEALDVAIEEVATEETAQGILAVISAFEDYVAAIADATADAATETTAAAILAAIEPLESYLAQIAENSSATDLNGFGLEKGENGEVILMYTDPETEEVESATLPTGTTQSEILTALTGIADSVELIAENASTDAESGAE